MSSWAHEEVMTADLGDRRLDERLATLLEQLGRHPPLSIPAACGGWAETVAAYRCFDNPKATFGGILAAHRDATLERMRACPVVLLAQDTTKDDESVCLGPKGLGTLKDMELHPTVAFTPQRICLGVVKAAYWSRETPSPRAERRHQGVDAKESGHWIDSYQDSCALQARLPDTLLVNLADREGDIYEWFAESADHAPAVRAQWIVRAAQDRRLLAGADGAGAAKLWAALGQAAPLGGVAVAWNVLKAGEKHAWKPEWHALLEQFRGLLPAGWTVIVLADRGLYAKWLFKAIAGLGWHPFLRVNGQGRFRPEGWFHWKPLSSVVPSKDDRWQGRGTAFNGRQSPWGCTLLAYWGEGHQGPWLMLTDLPPGYADACWYGLRAWIEQGFKRCKRGVWQWQHTRMGDPARAERLWMAIAIATWWRLSVGGEAEEQADTPLDVPAVPGTARRRGKRWRIVSVFQHGWSLIVASLLSHRLLPVKPGRPERWPGLPEINGSTLAISMAEA